ncbi:MAG: toxin HicA [Coriobacteriia bacterium]|nr:toxin HicA [Coriobacteriia bacterium]
MSNVEDIVRSMRASRGNVKFSDGLKVGMHFFGKPRISGSHYIFKTPWRGDPWVNMQNSKGKMKPYQAKQLLSAVDRLEGKKSV